MAKEKKLRLWKDYKGPDASGVPVGDKTYTAKVDLCVFVSLPDSRMVS